MASDRDLRDYLDNWGSELPNEYESRKAVVRSAYNAFKGWAASVLEWPLRQELRSMSQESYEQRKELGRWVNHECRSFGLAVACPKTGKPSLLMADPSGGRAGVGSFKFEIVGDSGKKTCLCYRSTLPEIKLIPDSEERSHWAEHARRINPNDRGRA
jgi:hypothetical protein